MSELQIGLLVLGVVVILGVLGFNWWQDRRARQKMQANLPIVQDDPLLHSSSTGERREPGLSHIGLSYAEGAEIAAESDAELDQGSEPDSVADAVIEITLPEPTLGSALMLRIEELRTIGRHPVQIYLQSEDGAFSTTIYPDKNYIAVQLAVLMVNRSGAITAIEWSQLWTAAQTWADKLDATLDGPEQDEVLKRAAHLDNACATLDAQVGLTLLLSAQRSIADVVGSATAMGFVMRDGALAWVGDHGMDCFTLARSDGEQLDVAMAGVDRLTLLLDVPRSPASPTGFARMLEVGLELARRVGGELVDDQGRPLVPGSEVAIDTQLQTLYSQLEAAGLPAGSARARRVFS